MTDSLALCAWALVAATLLMVVAWYLCNVALPWLEAKVSQTVYSREAQETARALFLSKLNGGQRRSWLFRRRITVTAKSGRRYTLCTYEAFNIHAWDAAFCVQVEGRTPVYDKLLAQKLLIECDEPLFLASANVRTFSVRWPQLIAAAKIECRRRGLLASPSAYGL